MMFHDVRQAAALLAERLEPYRGTRPLVLGFPRAGVLMARVIAEDLRGDVDVLLFRELRGGAVTEDGALVLLKRPHAPDVPARDVDEQTREALDLLRRQRARYTPRRPAASPAGRVAIVVDDGAAAGIGAEAALRALRVAGPSRLVVATALAPPGRVDALRARADDVVSLARPGYFGSVSRFFVERPEYSEEDVEDALR